MKDEKKTRQALITELQRLRRRLERVEAQNPETIQNKRFMRDPTGHRWLNRTALDLIALSDPKKILHYAGEMLTEHLGDCIVLTLTRPADEKALRIEGIHGISDNLLTRVVGLFQGRVRGRTFPIADHFEQIYRERRLHRHEGGLATFAAEGVPEAVATALARLVRADNVYTMALVGQQRVLGNLHILGHRPDLITEPEVVETFAHQVALALERATAYDAVSRGRRELEETLESLDEVVLRIDDELVIQLNNRASAEAMGIPQEAFVGRHCYTLLYGRETVCPGCPAQEAMETRQQASALRHILCFPRR